MSAERPKQSALVYVQRDIEAIKHTIDRVLRPYKTDMKSIRLENASLRENIARKEQDIERLLAHIASRSAEDLDDALRVLLDPSRTSWKKFRASWRHRLGLEER